MKLTSLALVAGGAVLGSNFGEAEVHDELRTKSLVIHGEEGGAVISSTLGGGLLIQLGEGGAYGAADFELGLDAGGWSMELRGEGGSSVKARVADGAARLEVQSAPGQAKVELSTHVAPNGGFADVVFYGGAIDGRDAQDRPCHLGVNGKHGFINIAERLTNGSADGMEEWDAWSPILRVGERSGTSEPGFPAIGPWNEGASK